MVYPRFADTLNGMRERERREAAHVSEGNKISVELWSSGRLYAEESTLPPTTSSLASSIPTLVKADDSTDDCAMDTFYFAHSIMTLIGTAKKTDISEPPGFERMETTMAAFEAVSPYWASRHHGEGQSSC